jgi:hypothetical protein
MDPPHNPVKISAEEIFTWYNTPPFSELAPASLVAAVSDALDAITTIIQSQSTATSRAGKLHQRMWGVSGPAVLGVAFERHIVRFPEALGLFKTMQAANQWCGLSAGRVMHLLGIHRRDRTPTQQLLRRLGLWAGSLINHGKPANGTSQHLGYQPVKDHSAKIISSQSKANEYPSALEWPQERLGWLSAVKSSLTATRL